MASVSIDINEKDFPYLVKYADLLEPVNRLPIGRDAQFATLEDSLLRPEMKNVVLLGPAGVGKTSFMEGYATIHQNEGVVVFDIDLSTMSGEGDNKFAARLKALADEIIKYSELRTELKQHGDTIIFLDEMHLITMNGMSGTGGGSAAGNALKPMMQRKQIKVVGATTDEEYERHIKPDQALTRRFQTMHMPEPDDYVTISILKNMASTYLGKENVPFIVDPDIYDEIVVYTNRYLPSFAQPAKSIDIMDAAIGAYRSARLAVIRDEAEKSTLKRFINHDLLARVLKEKAGVDIDWKSDISDVMQTIKSRVMGQDTAIKLIEGRLFVANAGLQDHDRPLANFLFAGATGTGKTELAKATAQAMFGEERHMIRYDMSEYSMPDDLKTFQQRLSSEISKKPYTVVLFDEMEKADRSIMHMLLAILDDGRLADQYGRQVTFTNAIIIVTTNGAADMFRDIRSQNLSVDAMDTSLRNELGKTFTPEFLGRFDEIIPFAPLEEEVYENIAKVELSRTIEKLSERFNITLKFDSRVLDYLVKERFTALNDTGAGGGRAMIRRISREVTPLIARVISEMDTLGKELAFVRVSVHGEMAIDNKFVARADSYLIASFVTRDAYSGDLSERMLRPELTKIKNKVS